MIDARMEKKNSSPIEIKVEQGPIAGIEENSAFNCFFPFITRHLASVYRFDSPDKRLAKSDFFVRFSNITETRIARCFAAERCGR